MSNFKYDKFITSVCENEYRNIQKTGIVDEEHDILHNIMRNFVERDLPNSIKNSTWGTKLREAFSYINNYDKHPLNQQWKDMLVGAIVDYNDSLQEISYDILTIMRLIICEFSYIPNAFMPIIINDYMMSNAGRRVSLILEHNVQMFLSQEQSINFKKACVECGDLRAIDRYLNRRYGITGRDLRDDSEEYIINDFYHDLPDEYTIGVLI